MPSDFAHLPKQLGRTVRKLREGEGLSQMKLAERAGLAHNFVGEVERGKKLASLDTIVRIAKALGISGAQLLGRAGL
jgi:transcriptional regulator with XRE-family HTH domain